MRDELIQAVCPECGMSLPSQDTYCLHCKSLDAKAIDIAIAADTEPAALLQERENPSVSIMLEGEYEADCVIEVMLPDEITATYTIGALQNDIAEGKVSQAFQARPKGSKDWSNVRQIAEGVFSLKLLYQPLWAHISRGCWLGVQLGVGLKALEVAYTLSEAGADGKIIMAWVAMVGSLYLARLWSLAPMAGWYFAFQTGAGMHLFGMFCGAAAVGAIFGGSLGALIGGVVGHFRKNHLPQAHDREPESSSPYYWGLLAPALFLTATIPLYFFWLLPKMVEWLATQN